jgi:hypothetical protein
MRAPCSSAFSVIVTNNFTVKLTVAVTKIKITGKLAALDVDIKYQVQIAGAQVGKYRPNLNLHRN